MREKLLSIGFVLMLFFTCVPVVIGESNNIGDTIASGQPDLVFDKFELIQQDDCVFLDWTVKNIGDASTGNESVRVNVSFCYFGVDFLFRNDIIDFFNLQQYPNLRLLLFITFFLHFYILPCTYHTRGTGPLDPGESDTCWWPVSWSNDEFEDDGWFLNDNICLIFRGIIDEYDTIAESDESNNEEVIRVWFPYRNDFSPSFPKPCLHTL